MTPNPILNPVIIIFSGLLPLGIAFLKQYTWPSWANFVVAFVTYAIVGVLAALVNGVPTGDTQSILTFVAAVTLYGSFAYDKIWSELGKTSEGALSVDDAITKATSVTGS